MPWGGPNAEIREQILEVARRVAASEGMEVVDVEYRRGGRRGFVRIYIDKRAGVTHADCELISRQVGVILDVEDFLPGPYVLEVSSPGLDRKLLKPRDYERFAGRKARVKLWRPVEDKSQFTGRLGGYENGEVVLKLDAGSEVRLPFEEIETARLVVEI